MGERRAPSLFQKKKHESAKSDASKKLFPDIGKITNRLSVCKAGGSGSEELKKCPPPSPAVL